MSSRLQDRREPEAAKVGIFQTPREPKRQTVLVAEDVSTNQDIIAEMLNLLGHEVDIADNGQTAVAKFLEGNYALIFMDCQMPIMDGYEASRRIRQLETEQQMTPIPIIALTAGSDRRDRDRCFEAGMNDYLTKPFSISDIQHAIDKRLLEVHLKAKYGKIERHQPAPSASQPRSLCKLQKVPD